MQRMRLRQSTMVQHHGELPDWFSFCGLYSVNNALLQRDFLTPARLRSVLKRLHVTAAGVDHGDVKLGAYTMHALHLALGKRGKRLVCLSGRGAFRAAQARRAERIAKSRRDRLIIIGRPGQQAGTWHAIARARVGDKLRFIDSNSYLYFNNEEHSLRSYFQYIDCIYHIVDGPKKQKKAIRSGLLPVIGLDVARIQAVLDVGVAKLESDASSLLLQYKS